jgi:hypothetical protein
MFCHTSLPLLLHQQMGRPQLHTRRFCPPLTHAVVDLSRASSETNESFGSVIHLRTLYPVTTRITPMSVDTDMRRGVGCRAKTGGAGFKHDQQGRGHHVRFGAFVQSKRQGYAVRTEGVCLRTSRDPTSTGMVLGVDPVESTDETSTRSLISRPATDPEEMIRPHFSLTHLGQVGNVAIRVLVLRTVAGPQVNIPPHREGWMP